MADQGPPEKNLDTRTIESLTSENAFIEFIRVWVGKSHDVSVTMANSDNHGEVEYYSVTREQLPNGRYSYKFYKVMLFEYDPYGNLARRGGQNGTYQMQPHIRVK